MMEARPGKKLLREFRTDKRSTWCAKIRNGKVCSSRARSEPSTFQDFNYCGLASGSGLGGFFELFHALLDTLYDPDFTDTETEREFYHFAVTTDSKTKQKKLVLRPKQEQLLQLLRDQKSLTPREIWDALKDEVMKGYAQTGGG